MSDARARSDETHSNFNAYPRERATLTLPYAYQSSPVDATDTNTEWSLHMNALQKTSTLLLRLYARAHHLFSQFTHPDIRPSNLFIDAVSLPMLNGSTIDYATELIGSSFRITGNPQSKGGCGCGVSWELNS